MDKVSKASDEMRGDLRRELEEAMINEESPSKAAKRFRNFVSADFANKYKNRLNLIATQEMNTIFNASAQASYEDSLLNTVNVKCSGEVWQSTAYPWLSKYFTISCLELLSTT